LDPNLHAHIKKRRKSITQNFSRLKAKRIASQHFLQRKSSQHLNSTVNKFLDAGEKTEEIVKSNNVGADAWRRTGVLTFNGNIKNTQKVTYEKIRKHLQNICKCHFSYGSVVQLCVAHNMRHKSAQRYKGIAKVTTRRARKGFQLKYNPDFHWSNAFYSGLNFVQLRDGSNLTIVNRDDASGFRLDSLTTHKQYRVPSVVGCDVLTTHIDYINPYPSTIQITSYNFTKTDTTSEVCVGVVKAVPLHAKNPAQHAADFEMLKTKEELNNVFYNEDGLKKLLCVRVDGGSDEGPMHKEVQFFWTLEHLKNTRLVILITTRSSGSSYLNRVELQNGCLTRGHSNLFIPSTLSGTCMESGHINDQALKTNLQKALDVYLSHVNYCPCGDTVIQLFEGADANDFMVYREHLRTFLKGSKTFLKKILHQEHPGLYKLLKDVWELREQHMIKGYPP